ncbi:MAG TPA: MFS transporter [Candidatus Binatia bacterium]|nr:MFS transporter [Candidatus Binatia bacterium]
MSVASASARTFRSLQRHRNYRLYFAGQLVSVTGTWVQNTAQAWLIVELTHSPLALGALALFQYLPYSVLGLFGGPLVDRFDKRVTIVATQTALMLSAAVLAGLAFSDTAVVWEVYVLAAWSGAVQVIDSPARQAFVFEMVGRKELPNAVSLNSSLFNAARVAGPAVGGALIAGVGVGFCFAVNAASFLAVIASLLLMRPGELYQSGRREPESVLRSLREGLTWTLHTPAAWLPCALLFVVATFGINFSVLLPVLASVTLRSGPVTFGIITACFGVGALTGALITAAVGRPSWRLLLGGGGVFSALLLVLAPLHWVYACGAVLLLTGVAFTTYTSSSNSTVQLAAPDWMRGRAMSVYSYVFTGTAPLGGLLAGWLSAAGGTQLAFIVAGGVSLLAVVGAVAIRAQALGGASAAATRPGRPSSSRSAHDREPGQGSLTSPGRIGVPAAAMAASSMTSESK